jgi:hypothetical protein
VDLPFVTIDREIIIGLSIIVIKKLYIVELEKEDIIVLID